MSNSSVTIFSLFYLVVGTCFVFKTTEFVSAGLTVEYLFAWYLKSEHEQFILYHIKRTSLTFLVHSLLPLGYLLGVNFLGGPEKYPNDILGITSLFWTAFWSFSIIMPSMAILAVLYWRQNDWANHPVVHNLKVFCGERPWRDLASEINIEFRRIDKVVLHPSSLTTVIATDNWLIKVTPYDVRIVHQGDDVLILTSADAHDLSRDGNGTVQFVNIEVQCLRPGIKPFIIRCDALDFRDLQNRLQRPVTILQGVTFHKSRVEQFTDVFREIINQNPEYELPTQLEVDPCMGCTVSPSNIKLMKQCDGECMNCNCRPLWCTDCMAKWWASRQDQQHPETWLSSNCTCPVCRSVFCILDVCPIKPHQA